MLVKYRALKDFQSPLLGNKVKGDVFEFGEDRGDEMARGGWVERVEKETKPEPVVKKETKPATKPVKKAVKK